MSGYAGTAHINNMRGNIHAGSRNSGRTETRTVARSAAHRRSVRTSRNILAFISTVIIAVFILIGLSAYAASIQHANNVLTTENAYLQAEIDSLNSQIVEETKVTRIESIATNEFGMVYPTSENTVYLNDNSDKGDNLAATIRSEAYN